MMMKSREALVRASARGMLGRIEILIRFWQLAWLTFGLRFRELLGARTYTQSVKEFYRALCSIIKQLHADSENMHIKSRLRFQQV